MAKGELEFENQTALVTGGSSGIGLALARLLAEKGARVWLMARRAEQLESARREIGQGCRSLAVDVADWDQVQRAVEQVTKETGTPDLVFNSAGVTRPGYVQDLDVEIFRQMIEINYMGTVHVVKAVLPGMLARGSGYIVNFSSVAGFGGIFGYTAYGASKYAVRGFSDALRAEMKSHGIRVSIVFPPDTDTPQLAGEKEFQPAETKVMNTKAQTRSAQEVAEIILDCVRKNRYIVLPGLDTRLFYHLNDLLGNGKYHLMDWWIRDARRQAGKLS